MVQFGMAVVQGRSMVPTLRAGDRLVVAYGATPRRGDLVVVRFPERPLSVKRAARTVREGWWVERDNPHEGVDSWLMGAVPVRDVLAVVRLRLWPRPRLFSGPPAG